MFSCTQEYAHPSIWYSSLPGKTDSECILCMLQYLKDESVSAVQKQVCVALLQQLVVEDNGHLIHVMQKNAAICYQIIDLCMDLYCFKLLSDCAVSACVSMIHCLQLESVFDHLLSKSKQKLKEMKEASVQFFLEVLTSLLSLCAMYSDIILLNHDDLLAEMLTKAEFMEEVTLAKLVVFFTAILKGSLCSVLSNGNESQSIWPFLLNELITIWLNTVQSVHLYRNVLVMVKEVVCQKNSVNNLLQLGSSDFSQEDLITGHALASHGFSFVLGLKRVLTRKEETLTPLVVECITLMMAEITEAEHLKMVFASDLSEFVFEALHTVNPNQLESVITCLMSMEKRDEFYYGCHAVYGIEPLMKSVKQLLDSQRYAVANLGMDLLKHMLQRQPENMPLFLEHSWTSCYDLLCQALQHSSSTFLVLAIEVTAAFLRPHHQQSPVDIEAIHTLIVATKSKIPQLLKFGVPEISLDSSSHCNDLALSCQIVMLNILDIMKSVTSLFNSNAVYCGNDITKVTEFHQLIQSTFIDLLQNQVCSKNSFPLWSSHESVEKFMTCLDSYISFSCHEYKPPFPMSSLTYISSSYLSLTTLLFKCGIPWLILKIASPFRNTALELQVSKILTRIFIPQMHGWSVTLQVKPDDLLSGFARLEWEESFVTLPETREGTLVFVLLLYLSYCHGYLIWSKADLKECLQVFFYQAPSIFTWHPLILKSFAFLTTMSQEYDSQENQNLQYESHIVQEMENTPVELWYTECASLFEWVLSTPCKAKTIGKLTIEYWLHQIALNKDTAPIEEEQEQLLHCLQGNFAFLSILVEQLRSHTIGSVARQILMLAICDADFVENPDEKSMWENLLFNVNQALESVILLAPEMNESALENTLPILMTLMLKEWDLDISWLHSVRSLAQVSKYISHGDRSQEEQVSGLRFLSMLVRRLTAQESKTVIPPLMQNSQFVSLLSTCLKSTNNSLVSSAFSLSEWISAHGAAFQAPQPIVISTAFLMSSLASGKQRDICAILKLINSAFRMINTSQVGSILFSPSEDTCSSHQSLFTITELHQLYIYAQQHVVQEDEMVQCQAVELMENIMAQDLELKKYLLHHPWNSFLMETVSNSQNSTAMTDPGRKLCALLSPMERQDEGGHNEDM